MTSFNPLEAWLFKDGFARFSTKKFSLNNNTKNDAFIHLTNSSVQKNADNAPTKASSSSIKNLRKKLKEKDEDEWAKSNRKGGLLYEENRDELGDTKRSFDWIWKTLIKTGVLQPNSNDINGDDVGNNSGRNDVNSANEDGGGGKPTQSSIWESISELIVKSLLCVDNHIPHNPNAFEVFGYDVIIDDNMRPWLLEVNASPSMSRDNKLDIKIKEQLILDTIALVDPLPFDRNILLEVLDNKLSKKQHSRQQKNDSGNGDNMNEKSVSTTTQEILAADDILRITKGRIPRQIGEMPRRLGKYELIAPNTPIYHKCLKIKTAVSH